ncbi:hypothetical protein Q7424_10485 [Glaesserella parasuis]|nr:hypothetical protein [Glaesserella parasuis]MDO9942335.1 hypothetical protein [Glaesserella parasuis]MDP0012489.1 hypothetical protein [Glaesserella parasuis]
MANYGIATDSLPMFLGSECVIALIKTIKLKYRDVHKDITYHIDFASNTTQERLNDFEKKGWIDVVESVIPLDDLFVFVGVQSLQVNNTDASLNIVRFRHKGGKTQARIAVTSRQSLIRERYNNLDNYVEIFIFRRLSVVTPNQGYGVHIYDSQGNLKYKDGLNLLTNIRKIPVYFNDLSNVEPSLFSPPPFSEEKNPQLKNLGTNIAVLQSTNCIRTECYLSGRSWQYYGNKWTPSLKKDGTVKLSGVDSFLISGIKRSYPSYAKGGAYIDNVICSDHIIVIDKPA